MTPKRRRLRRRPLLQDREIARWHANMSRGSPITADTYIRRLGAFCEYTETTPSSLLKLTEKEAHSLFLDFVSAEEKKQRSGAYIMSSIKAVKSWLLHNGMRVGLPVKVDGADRTPTLEGERTPTQDELRRLFLAATVRDRVSCVLMAHSGVRTEVLGDYTGKDGLRLKDFPEMKTTDSKVEFVKVPTMVVVRPELSKTGRRYITFLGEEGCSYLRDYLEQRLTEGEELGPETDLIHPKGSGKSAAKWTGDVGVKPFMYTTKIGNQIRLAIRAAGFQWRPYILRAYFDTQLLLAESRGKIAHDYRVFWMGHKGSMDARYTTNKGRLAPEMIEDMREAYRRCEPLLTTMPTKGPDQAMAKMSRAFLKALHYSDEELAKIDLETLDENGLAELLGQRLPDPSPRVEASSPGRNPPRRQRIVKRKEIDALLADGWTVDKSLGRGEYVVNPPAA